MRQLPNCLYIFLGESLLDQLFLQLFLGWRLLTLDQLVLVVDVLLEKA